MVAAPSGAIAQLVERFHGMEEVESSILSSSTLRVASPADRAVGFFLGGLFAGEGYFSATPRVERLAEGSPRMRFRFGISLAARDRDLLVTLQDVLTAGSIYVRRGAREHHQPIATLLISSRIDHHRATIPFAEVFLPPSVKREQFEQWRDALYAYEDHDSIRWGRGPSTCREPDCERPVRGRGLCRRHYYRATGY
jgi:hypothetical protein